MMRDYHHIWLASHRNRTEQWLRERLEDGFDIHHADGDHSNNDPDNLVLIEATDHMRLHGSGLMRLLGDAKTERKQQRLDLGGVAYDMKDRATSWTVIGSSLYPDSPQPQSVARVAARDYAINNGLPFPKPDSASQGGRRRKVEHRS